MYVTIYNIYCYIKKIKEYKIYIFLVIKIFIKISWRKNYAFLEAVQSGFLQYSNFSERASRSEFWYFRIFSLFSVVIAVFLMLLLTDLTSNVKDELVIGFVITVDIVSILYIIIVIPVTNISLSVRRFHDIGFSGWLYFILLLLTGDIAILILSMLDSQPGNNKYGPNPKELINFKQ